jgi:hypothetical protein
VKNQQDFIKSQNDEKVEVMASYEKDIERYKSLKSGAQAPEQN